MGWKDLLIDAQKDSEYAEEHCHHNVRWFGKLPVQTATNWCTPLDQGLTNFYRAISGAATYGSDAGDEAQLFGTADVPIVGMKTGDFNEILIVANSANTLYLEIAGLPVKIWLQTMNATDNATIDFVVGVHGYTF